MGSALCAVLMMGSGCLRHNIAFYALQTAAVAIASAMHFLGHEAEGSFGYGMVALLVVGKALFVPAFLYWLSEKIDVRNDPCHFLPIPVAMHISVGILGMSYFLSLGLPVLPGCGSTLGGAIASISLFFMGILFMLTRCVALSQILGFLTLENGVALFAVTQTRGMPLIIEMGAFLDVLALVMLGGLFVFRIKRSFEHVDVSSFGEAED
jgi:hydrogenase-4 component E